MYVALAILLLAAIACGSPEPVEPTPTPDVPLFAEGEAVALVEAEIVNTRDLRHIEWRDLCARQDLLEDVIYATTTASSYLGQGVWVVRSEPFGDEIYDLHGTSSLIYRDSSFEWKVYEFSGVVQSTNWATTFSMTC